MRVAVRQIFPHQKRGRLPAAQVNAELLNELLQAQRALRLMSRFDHDRTERVDEDQPRRRRLDFADNTRQHLVEIAGRYFIAQIDEANRLGDLLGVEERKLLLIAQHLQRRFSQHGEEQRRALLGGQSEHDLVGKRRLTGTRGSHDEIEGEFRDAAAQNRIEPRHSRGQVPYGYFVVHSAFRPEKNDGADQTGANNRVVNDSPINAASNSVNDKSSA